MQDLGLGNGAGVFSRLERRRGALGGVQWGGVEEDFGGCKRKWRGFEFMGWLVVLFTWASKEEILILSSMHPFKKLIESRTWQKCVLQPKFGEQKTKCQEIVFHLNTFLKH